MAQGDGKERLLPLAKKLSFAVAGYVFAHPEGYHVPEVAVEPAMDPLAERHILRSDKV